MNINVSNFLDALSHPRREEIEELRRSILSSDTQLQESVKWNGPHYTVGGADRITLKVQPVHSPVVVVMHCGAKSHVPDVRSILSSAPDFLEWKSASRATITFANLLDISVNRSAFVNFIQQWLQATK